MNFKEVLSDNPFHLTQKLGPRRITRFLWQKCATYNVLILKNISVSIGRATKIENRTIKTKKKI